MNRSSTTSKRTTIARIPTICRSCANPIRDGDQITFCETEHTWVHDECVLMESTT